MRLVEVVRGGLASSFSLGYQNYKQKNLYWERRINLSFDQMFLYGSLNLPDQATKLDFGHILMTSLGYWYYPNSRTSGGLSVGLESSSMRLYSALSSEVDYSLALRPVFDFSMNYYISPQLRLELDYTSAFLFDREVKLLDPQAYIKQNDFNFRHSVYCALIYRIF